MTLDIKEHIGRTDAPKGETIELNVVSVNEGKSLYDLGRWTSDGRRKVGVLMERHQLFAIRDILNRIT